MCAIIIPGTVAVSLWIAWTIHDRSRTLQSSARIIFYLTSVVSQVALAIEDESGKLLVLVTTDLSESGTLISQPGDDKHIAIFAEAWRHPSDALEPPGYPHYLVRIWPRHLAR